MFADVAPGLTRWREAGLALAIFSSGSLLAQKLLFGFSTAGDLTRFIDHHFDTTTGAKTEAESYRRIAEAIRVAASEVLFVSDIPRELDAAQAAGMQVILAIRPGNAAVDGANDYRIIRSFDELVANGR